MQVTASFKQVTCGTELPITQEGMPEVIPPEVCYLGWQESLMQLAKLATITTTIGVSVWYGLCSSEQSVRLAGLLSLPVPGDGARGTLFERGSWTCEISAEYELIATATMMRTIS